MAARTKVLLAAVVALAASCACPATVDLPSRYAPLARLEDASQVDAATGLSVYHAFGPVLRGSTCDYLSRSQKEQEALLLHEQLIAQHQLAYPGGVDGYIAACRRDPRFLVSEELSGWEVQVTYLVRSGVAIDKIRIATFLSSAYGPTLDYTSAVYWVEDVLGRLGVK